MEIALYCRSGARSGATRKSGGAERSGERALQKKRGSGAERGAGTERGAEVAGLGWSVERLCVCSAGGSNGALSRSYKHE